MSLIYEYGLTATYLISLINFESRSRSIEWSSMCDKKLEARNVPDLIFGLFNPF